MSLPLRLAGIHRKIDTSDIDSLTYRKLIVSKGA